MAHASAGSRTRPVDGYFLFVGTLVPRKNVPTLLDAYARLLATMPDAPRLVIAGAATEDSGPWIERLQQAPLAGRVDHLGYVAEADRERLYAGARALIMPSLDEGFGVPALEAMAAGVPVIASNRGALPEVLGAAGTLLDPQDVEGFAEAMRRRRPRSSLGDGPGQRRADPRRVVYMAGHCRSSAAGVPRCDRAAPRRAAGPGGTR